MEFKFLEKIILNKIYFKQNRLIEEFNKYRLNNDFEYGWKKINNGWVVDNSTDITCWNCISQAKHFILEEAYCDICLN